MDVMIVGGLIRFIGGLAAATPTLIVGLFVAAVFKYYLGQAGTNRLFGGNSLRSLPQSWLIGMLLPVCSIGVIPIIREMKRMGMRPGTITAFALSAPLFNPLSLLYGLTLSRPYVIIGFALASLLVVTVLGIVWDRSLKGENGSEYQSQKVISLQRLIACGIYMVSELVGSSGRLALIALSGLFLLGFILPHGALQSSVEQLDPLAPLKMTLVSIPIYATPILTMSQLGMMFAHGNSPGAAFCLLLLGTGVNLATLWWIASNYGMKPTAIWFSVLLITVLVCAYAVDRPLIPQGVTPAGHTHAFDIYTNPLQHGSSLNWMLIKQQLTEKVNYFEWFGLSILVAMALVGIACVTVFPKALLKVEYSGRDADQLSASAIESPKTGLSRHVSPGAVGLVCLAGLVAFSVVACFAFYPDPKEVLEEMRLARAEVIGSATVGDYEQAMHWIPVLDDWSRKLEVGYFLRNLELRPYQQMQAHLLRKKLELLEHAAEHALNAKKEIAKVGDDPHLVEHLNEELNEIEQLKKEIFHNSTRLRSAFQKR